MPVKSKKSAKKKRHEKAEEFGEKIKEQAEDFAEEVEDIGERISRRFEEKKTEKKMRWHHPFGFLWPLFGSIFGIILLVAGLMILDWLNIGLGSSFVPALTGFLFSNLPWLFLAGLFFGYTDFASKILPKAYWLFSPIAAAVGITFVVWLFAGIFVAINVSAKSGFIERLANFVFGNLLGIFVFFLLFGYVILFLARFIKSMEWY
ncbi:MAG TPA: hypothetical protein VI977_02560 [archaeon]|nr:hypothetical protein [archaeon]